MAIDPNKDISKTRQVHVKEQLVNKMSDRKKISCIQIFRWIQVYHGLMQRLLNTQGLPKYIYLSPPLIFPTTYNGIGTKNRPV